MTATMTETALRMTVMRADFSDALQSLSSVITRTPKPVRACVHLLAADNRLVMRTTNLEMAMEAWTEKVQVESVGEAAVNCAKLAAIAREMQDETLSISMAGDIMVVRGAASEFKLNTLPPGDFPPMPEMKDAKEVSLPAEMVEKILSLTLWATSEESNRYAFNGVRIFSDKGNLVAWATESHAAVDYRTGLKAEIGSAIIPVPACRLAMKLCDAGEVTLSVSENAVRFGGDWWRLQTNLIDGNMPPLDDVIPKDCDRIAVIGRAEFASAIRQASLTAEEGTHGVKLRLSFDKGGLTIDSADGETGSSCIKVPCRFEGADMTIGMQSRWLLDAMRPTADAEVRIGMCAPNRPMLLDFGAGYRVVAMPTNLNA